ncbi:IS1 family transposase, partial [Candidatus Poribacteria bacterium]|nr:IS1 family transposase [Candidatus Poribacteria bacterium]
YPEKVRQQAVTMYCEGTSIEAISRVQSVKVGTVTSWTKKPDGH